MTTPTPPSSTHLSAAAQNTVLVYSVLIGLCPLIPIPFVDEFVLGMLSRRMARLLIGQHNLSFSESNIQHLTRERVGCPLGCLYSFFLAPIKKMVKTLVFFLAFRDCVNASSRWLHRGYLLSVALERGVLGKEQLNQTDGVWPVALAIEESIISVDTSPINQMVRRIFSQSRALLRRTAVDLYRRLRPHRRSPGAAQDALVNAVNEDEQVLAGVLHKLSDAFWGQRDYLQVLEQVFLAKLEQTTARMQVTADD